MLSINKFTTLDIPIINKASRQAWPTTPAIRQKIVNNLTDLMDDDTIKTDERIKVINTLVKIEGQNQKERLATMGKMTIEEEVSHMTDEQLLQQIKELENNGPRLPAGSEHRHDDNE